MTDSAQDDISINPNHINNESVVLPVVVSLDATLQEFYVTLEELRLSLSIGANQIRTVSSHNKSDFIQFMQNLLHSLLSQMSKLSDELRLLQDIVMVGTGGSCSNIDNDEVSSSSSSVECMIFEDCCRKARCEALSCLMLSILCELPHDVEEDEFSRQFLSKSILETIEHYNGPLPDGPELQSAVASMVEMTIILCSYRAAADQITSKLIRNIIIPIYTNFQRKTLRVRSKPSIKNLVNIRQTAAKFSHMNEGDEGEEDIKGRQPHVHAITCILAEGSILLQPIRGWFEAINAIAEDNNEVERFLLEMLQRTSTEIDDEAQDLSSTVGNWLSEDRDVKGWVSNAMKYMSANPQQNENKQDDIDVTGLDNVLEELAFVCQVSARYCEFIHATKIIMDIDEKERNDERHPLWLLLQEHSGQYATLEDCLSKSSLDKAINIAAPVEISDRVFVPSVVEDAFFVSRRAVERAASTFNSQALITLANRIAEAWGHEGGIYQALIADTGTDHINSNAEKLVASSEVANLHEGSRNGTNKDKFTSSFLDAIDDDIGAMNSTKQRQVRPADNVRDKCSIRMGLRERRLLGSFCALNGIASASSATSALSALFDSIVQSKNNENSENSKSGELVILEFACDELKQHEIMFDKVLVEKSHDVIDKWCGYFSDKDSHIDSNISLCFPAMQDFIRKHVYELDANGCAYMESDDVLGMHLIAPLKNCDIFQEMKDGRCEPRVTLELVKTFAAAISAMLFSETISAQKPFTDWGALVLSKQIRLLQDSLCSLLRIDDEQVYHQNPDSMMTTAPILSKFERISQACAILQLEKPSDWTAQCYGYHSDDNLSVDEIRGVMYQRVDFSKSTIDKICEKLE